jgi:hypothetical protein
LCNSSDGVGAVDRLPDARVKLDDDRDTLLLTGAATPLFDDEVDGFDCTRTEHCVCVCVLTVCRLSVAVFGGN